MAWLAVHKMVVRVYLITNQKRRMNIGLICILMKRGMILK